jgi:hypothetical protein
MSIERWPGSDLLPGFIIPIKSSFFGSESVLCVHGARRNQAEEQRE